MAVPLFLIGVAMTIVASFLTTLGMLIQKKSYTAPPERMLKVWLIGLALMAVAAVLELSAFGFASQSVIAPLSACNLVVNILLSPCVIGDHASRADMIATAIVILGCVLAISFGDQTVVDHTIDDMIGYWGQPAVIVFILILLCSIVVSALGVYRLEAPYRRARRKANPRLWKQKDVLEWLHKVGLHGKLTDLVPEVRIDGPALLQAEFPELHACWGVEGELAQELWTQISALKDVVREIDARGAAQDDTSSKLMRAMSFLTPLDSINMGLKPLEIGALYSANRATVEEALSPRSRKTFWDISSALWDIMDEDQDAASPIPGAVGSPLSSGDYVEDDPLQVITVRLHMLHASAYSYAAGSAAAVATLFAKCAVEGLKEGLGAVLASWYFWVATIFGCFALFLQMRFLNWALQYHAALLVVPIFLCCKIILTISGGGLYFQEFDNFSGFQLGMFGLGVAVTVAGIVMLTVMRGRSQAEERKRLEEGMELKQELGAAEQGLQGPGVGAAVTVDPTPRSRNTLEEAGITSPTSQKLHRVSNPMAKSDEELELDQVLMTPTSSSRGSHSPESSLQDWTASPMASPASSTPSAHSRLGDDPRRAALRKQAELVEARRLQEDQEDPTLARQSSLRQADSLAALKKLNSKSSLEEPPKRAREQAALEQEQESLRQQAEQAARAKREAEEAEEARLQESQRQQAAKALDAEQRRAAAAAAKSDHEQEARASSEAQNKKISEAASRQSAKEQQRKAAVDKIRNPSNATQAAPSPAPAPRAGKLGSLIRAAGDKHTAASPPANDFASPCSPGSASSDLLSPPSKDIPKGDTIQGDL